MAAFTAAVELCIGFAGGGATCAPLFTPWPGWGPEVCGRAWGWLLAPAGLPFCAGLWLTPVPYCFLTAFANVIASPYCFWHCALRSSCFFRSSGGRDGLSCSVCSIVLMTPRALSIWYKALAYFCLISSSHFALSGTLGGAWNCMSLRWLMIWGGNALACAAAAVTCGAATVGVGCGGGLLMLPGGPPPP
jgi:hypothetical protein